MLDVRYSGAYLQIEHHSLHMNRFEKLALVGDWPAGSANLLICQQKFSGDTNCEVCEKCMWAMTALVALVRLDAAPSVAEDDVSPNLLGTVQECDMVLGEEGLLAQYELLIPDLSQRGRHDLVDVIRRFRPDWERKWTDFESAIMVAADVVPSGANVIVADCERWGYPFPSRQTGRYWGQPRDGATAIRELAHLREAGADFLVLTRNALWCPDYYPGHRDHLWPNCRCLREDERFIIFDLSELATHD
jgi:hypothetical protein